MSYLDLWVLGFYGAWGNILNVQLILTNSSGTGIFLQPPAVLLLTRSKGEALGLWILGFAYTLVRYVPWVQELTVLIS